MKICFIRHPMKVFKKGFRYFLNKIVPIPCWPRLKKRWKKKAKLDTRWWRKKLHTHIFSLTELIITIKGLLKWKLPIASFQTGIIFILHIMCKIVSFTQRAKLSVFNTIELKFGWRWRLKMYEPIQIGHEIVLHSVEPFKTHTIVR